MGVIEFKSKYIKRALLTIILLMFFQSAVSLADPSFKKIKLISEPWLNSTQADGVGIYWDIMRLVYEPIGIKVEYQTTDYANSIALVKEGKMDAMIGSYLDEEKGIIYPKWHIDADVVSAMYKDRPNFRWRGEKSLIGKNVGWIKGYNYNKYIVRKFNMQEFLTRKKAIELLENGQLDFFLEAQVEIQNELKKGYCDSKHFTYNTLMHLNIYPAFVNNERGYQLQRIFDQRFAHLLELGEIKKLFEKWNWPIYPFTKFCKYSKTSMINC